MAILDGLRPFQRLYNGIQIQLRLDDWPADVPLPVGSTVVGIGEDHEELVYPTWRFIFEPEGTIEVVGGWFKIPYLLEQAVEWYKTELTTLGWIQETECGFVQPDWAVLYYQLPEHIYYEGFCLNGPRLARLNYQGLLSFRKGFLPSLL